MTAAVIFDVDGVLLDSPHERAWREALHELMTGEWCHLRSTWSPSAFTPQLYQRLDRALAARRFVERLRADGVPMAAASSSCNAPALLRRAGFTLPVDMSGRATRGKPAPDLFLMAAHALGVEPEQCTVVEDAQAGIEAAKAGGDERHRHRPPGRGARRRPGRLLAR